MSYKNTSIKSVVSKINSSYFIPDIQRNYVWLENPQKKKIEQLFDSLMRGYPIGAFLFWNLNKNDIESDNNNDTGKINFQLYKFIERYDEESPNNEKLLISQLNVGDLNIVLDGQQRLTSLYIGLKGSRRLKRPYARKNDPNQYETKFLFLNLLHKPTDENPDDCYDFKFLTPNEAKNKTDGVLWFRVSEVLEFADRDEVRNYCKEKKYNQEAQDVVEDLWRVVVDDNVITYFEEHKKSLDKVLKIFIRVNSGGVQLSYSDLLMSLLTSTFKSEIREKMDEVVKNMKNNGFKYFGRDQVLKTCMLLSGCNHTFKMENFGKENIRKMESNWDEIISYLYSTTTILRDMGYENRLSSGYIIAVICFYLFMKKCEKPKKCDINAMTKFVQIAQMKGFFTTGLDGKLERVKQIMEHVLSEKKDFEYFVTEMEKKEKDFGVDAKYIEWAVEFVEYDSPAILPILQVLYPNLKYGSVKFHIDHIYPKSKFNKKNKELPQEYAKRGVENGLWNLQMLEGGVNESKNNKDPEIWIQEEMPEPQKRKAYFEANYIPENFKLEWSNIARFESERKEKIIKRLMEVFSIKNTNE